MSFLTLDAFSDDFNPTALEALLMGLKNPMGATLQSWDGKSHEWHFNSRGI